MFEQKRSGLGPRKLRTPSSNDLATLRRRLAEREGVQARELLEALRIEMTVQSFPAGSLTGVAVAAVAIAFAVATVAPESVPDALIAALALAFSATTIGIVSLGLARQNYEASAASWVYAVDCVLAEPEAVRVARDTAHADGSKLISEREAIAEALISFRLTVNLNWPRRNRRGE
jgi:hypothetical protein